MTISANPLKGTGHLYPAGLSWFAEMVFGVDLASKKNRDDISGAIESLAKDSESLFRDADFLKGLDFDDEANAAEVMKRFEEHKKTPEWFGFAAVNFYHLALDAIKSGNAAEAAWAMAAAERFRALTIFKANFEEVVFMGHSARKLVDLLKIWDANKTNADEGFWQTILSEHSYALSQLFSVPVTLIKGKAYVGGMTLDSKDARYLDYLLSGGTTNEAILLEIKTPVTKLLGRQYRKNVYPPSPELSGSIVQVSDYSHSLRENISTLTKGSDIRLSAFNPRRVVIIGSHERELNSSKKRDSFELFRSSLAGIEIVTFDELFKKIEQLAKLFNLVRRPDKARANTD